MIDQIVKLWYKIPRFKCNFNIYRQDKDDRNFQWYKDRKEYGFDERILWDLSYNMEVFINKKYKFVQTEKNHWGGFKGTVSYVTIYRDIINGNRDRLLPIAKFMFDRMERYVLWECPISIYDKENDSFVSNEIVDSEISKMLNVLDGYIRTGQVVKRDLYLISKYFNHFGW